MAGSTTLRLPDGLSAEAKAEAEALGVSLNALCAFALRQYLDARKVAAAAVVLPPAKGVKPPSSPPRTTVSPVSRGASTLADRVDSGEVKVSRNDVPKVGANQPCPCGSGKKYKRCHGQP